MDKTTLNVAAINRAITDLRFLRDVGYDGESKEVIRNMFQGAIDVLVVCADAFKDDTAAESDADMVNEPPHYKVHAKECIDEMLALFGPRDVFAYCMLNAWKYRYRANAKGNAEQDNAKADWYIAKANEINNEYCICMSVGFR